VASPLPTRNIAIIAHVDHGKTTLVDQMLRQTGVFRSNQNVEDRVMDSDPIEKERGITILSKNASLKWGGTKINIVDTPGHADFGGEVERILRMVNGVLILVDAAEGPMPQTRFVTRKALDLGLRPVVVVNKIDRPDARSEEVHDEVLDLLIDLDATPDQLDAPFLYASGRDGTATPELDVPGTDLTPLFQTILDWVPPPEVDPDGPFQMLVSTIDHSPYVGRIGIGRVERGRVTVGSPVALLFPGDERGEESLGTPDRGKVQKIIAFEGLAKVDVEEAVAGQIVGIAGMDGVEIGQTLSDPEHLEALVGIAVEEPTLSVDFTVNDSPLAGRSGKYLTTRHLRERLDKELERNVALRVEAVGSDTFSVSGRGELHLTILMEQMRREGYEFQVSRPRVVQKTGPNGERLEPWEEAVVEVPAGVEGSVIEKLGARRGEMLELRPDSRGHVRLRYKIPARGLFGYRSEFMTDTRGEGMLHHQFLEYGEWVGDLGGRRKGVLVADRPGDSVAYAIWNLQERALMFIGPGESVYQGMILGEHVRPGDLDVNITKGKKLTNMRTTSSDEAVRLETPRRLTLELSLEFIDPDELIEITPSSIRLRKRVLDPNERKKAARDM
jgi:GTP-binding protein